MTFKYLTIFPLMALAACSQPGGNPEFFGGQTGAAGVGQMSSETLGPAPSSPEFFSQTVGDRVLFEVDEFAVSASGRTVLDAQAVWLQANPSYDIIIEGHADEQGTREYNLALGFRRAQSVQEYLVARGVSPLRLKTRSFGKERPIEICSSEECYAKNRRSVTILTSGVS